MNRLALTVAIAASLAGTAHAQQEGGVGNAFVRVDPVGVPIAVVRTPLLEPGWYELQTFDLQGLPTSTLPPDTVVTVRGQSHVRAATLSGADACLTPGADAEILRSCVRFQHTGTRARRLHAWVRAWQTGAAGTASLRIQRVASGVSVPADVACTSEGQAGCWTTFATDVSFGGMVVRGSEVGGNVEGLMQLETTELPGAGEAPFPSWHAIMFGLNNDNIDNNYFLRRNEPAPGGVMRGAPNTHPSGVGGTAIWTGEGRRRGFRERNRDNTTIIAGPILAHAAGPFRLLRNDRVSHRDNEGVLHEIGTDVDGDGLGRDLEDILRTCDSTASPASNGFDCRPPQCIGPLAAWLCHATLRDSDFDGMRDDHELYGVGMYGGLERPGTELARFGADPAQVDIMLEIDYEGEASSAGDRCVAHSGDVELTPQMLRDIASIYRHIPGFRNRNGTNGIHVHLDAGEAVETPADRGVFGNWGGSQPAVCWTEQNDAAPEAWETKRQDGIALHRRWLFRHVNRFPGGSGGSNVFDLLFAAGSATAIAHELGHALGLAHEGPSGATGINGNPIHLSRINYMYEYWAERDGANLGDVPHNPLFDSLTFSDGRFSGTNLDQRNLDELCPLGPGVDVGMLPLGLQWGNAMAHAISFGEVEGCMSIDWNRDGGFSNTPVQARITRVANHSGRHSFPPRVATAFRSGGDLAVAGNRLFHARLVADGAGVRSELVVNNGLSCSECVSSYEGETGSCWDGQDAHYVIELVDAQGAPLLVQAIALSAARPTSGGDLLVYVAHGFDGRLVWGSVDPVSLAQFHGGALPKHEPLSMDSGEEVPSLAAVGGNEHELLLAYRRFDGAVFTQRARAASGSTILWNAPVPADDADGNQLVAEAGSSVGVGTVHSGLGNGVALAVRTASGLHVMFRPLGGVRWGGVATLEDTLWSRPSLAQTSYPSGDRLVLAFTDTGKYSQYSESGLNTLTGWEMGFGVLNAPRDVAELLHGAYRAANPPLLAWDGRPSASPPGLRAVHGQALSCEEDSDCSGFAGTCMNNMCQASNASDLVVGVREYLLPFADGIFPGILRDFDDRPMMRFGTCTMLRECHSQYDDGQCVPAEYVERNPLTGAPLHRQICPPLPTYPPVCEN